MPYLQPAEYFAIEALAHQLINAYNSVNDLKTVATFQALTFERITNIGGNHEEIVMFCNHLDDVTINSTRLEKELVLLKNVVSPFEAPSQKQMEKVFRKVKKLNPPAFANWDLRNYSYLSWNDPGSQKKFILARDGENGQLRGIYGSFSPNIKRNICAICHHTSNVALFMATTKTGSEGTYTKRGNYICVDGEICNQQLHDYEHFQKFLDHLR
ncbi:FusB/FusC family EF-G-binding protein [Enterococcus timonensis]|uniref:FusB/FusC family EF-G-binding protein n=1 Tax=Enterococcus timonensis TaxID=1852364 RepID=UPI0008D9D4A4|nr:FusB/FusC family EF-G-binding protein [Enterococcus timonensis]